MFRNCLKMSKYLLIVFSFSCLVFVTKASSQGGGIVDKDKSSRCEGECGILHLVDQGGETLAELQGEYTNFRNVEGAIKGKFSGVENVKMSGSGCFVIYESRNHEGQSFQLEGKKIHNLRDSGGFTTVK